MAEIKKAYRQKALETHPDKNRGKDPEAAAEEFRQVRHRAIVETMRENERAAGFIHQLHCTGALCR